MDERGKLDRARRAGQAAPVHSIDVVKEPGRSEGWFPSGSFGSFAPLGEKKSSPVSVPAILSLTHVLVTFHGCL